jgi:hypothetical protein
MLYNITYAGIKLDYEYAEGKKSNIMRNILFCLFVLSKQLISRDVWWFLCSKTRLIMSNSCFLCIVIFNRLFKFEFKSISYFLNFWKPLIFEFQKTVTNSTRNFTTTAIRNYPSSFRVSNHRNNYKHFTISSHIRT